MSSTYDRLAKWYDLLAWPEQPIRRHIIALVAPQPGERIAFLGCGTGHEVVMAVPRIGVTGICAGLDLSEAMCRRARRRLEDKGLLARTVIIQGDAQYPPLASGIWDAILMVFTLEILNQEEAERVLQASRALLRPQGRLGIAALVWRPKNKMAKTYLRLYQRWPQWIDCRPINLREIIERAGFEVQTYHERSLGGLPIGLLLATRP